MAPELGRACVITVSDGVSAGVREDRSGEAVRARLVAAGFRVERSQVLPDDPERLTAALVGASGDGFELVVTTGGTGLGPRDRTPEATAAALDYEVRGLAEEMRRAGALQTPMAVLSRALAGVRGSTLILNLPGSERGATQSLDAISSVLPHALQLLRGDTEHR